MGIYITHAAGISALGPDLSSTATALDQGKSGIGHTHRFDTAPHVGPWAAQIEALGNEPTPPGQSRIFNLAQALLAQLPALPSDALMITASTKGGIDAMDEGGHFPGPGYLPSDLPHYLARNLGFSRSGFNINAACTSSSLALARGAQKLMGETEEVVLVAGLDLVSEFVFSGFSALGAMSPHPALPFDTQRQGLTLGEAGAALVLMNERGLARTGAAPLAKILGWGGANDATHLTAPARDGAGLKKAIHAALAMADLPPEGIGAINTHGTGTRYNDQMELLVLNDLFSHRPANSIKGATGHTLGAAGILEAALALQWLKTGRIPGTHGLKTPEPLARGFFSHAPQALSQEPGQRTLLTTTSGFGGINAALILGDI